MPKKHVPAKNKLAPRENTNMAAEGNVKTRKAKPQNVNMIPIVIQTETQSIFILTDLC